MTAKDATATAAKKKNITINTMIIIVTLDKPDESDSTELIGSSSWMIEVIDISVVGGVVVIVSVIDEVVEVVEVVVSVVIALVVVSVFVSP